LEEEFRKSAADTGVSSIGSGQGKSSHSLPHSHSHSQASQHPLSYTHPHVHSHPHSHSHSHSHKPSTPRSLRSLSTKGGGVHKKLKWQTVTSLVRRLQAKRALTRLHPPPRGLCGCVTFEVQWKNVHGILYQNFLQVCPLQSWRSSTYSADCNIAIFLVCQCCYSMIQNFSLLSLPLVSCNASSLQALHAPKYTAQVRSMLLSYFACLTTNLCIVRPPAYIHTWPLQPARELRFSPCGRWIRLWQSRLPVS